MSYENRFSIKVINTSTEKKGSMVCPEHGTAYPMGTKFCPEHGTKLEEKVATVPVEDIISKFRETTEDAYLIDDSGDTERAGSGYAIQEDLVKFSMQYPDAIFQLNVKPDAGFDSGPERYYIKDGKTQTCGSVTTFDEYDENKLELKH